MLNRLKARKERGSVKKVDVFDKALDLLDTLYYEGYTDEEQEEVIIRMWLELTGGKSLSINTIESDIQ